MCDGVDHMEIAALASDSCRSGEIEPHWEVSKQKATAEKDVARI